MTVQAQKRIHVDCVSGIVEVRVSGEDISASNGVCISHLELVGDEEASGINQPCTRTYFSTSIALLSSFVSLLRGCVISHLVSFVC